MSRFHACPVTTNKSSFAASLPNNDVFLKYTTNSGTSMSLFLTAAQASNALNASKPYLIIGGLLALAVATTEQNLRRM